MTQHKTQQLAEQLSSKGAEEVRNKIINNLVPESDNANDGILPYMMPSLEALRKAKNKEGTSHLFPNNIILSLWIMSVTPPFDEFIRNISLVPFILHYWSNLQVVFNKRY